MIPKTAKFGFVNGSTMRARRVPNMQLEKMKQARDLGLNLSFVASEERVAEAERLTQTPRVFYRRESEGRPLIVAKGSR